jgi:hypothetical protein
MQQRRDLDSSFAPQRWNFVPVKPGADASLRRSNRVTIFLLLLLVLGLLIVAFVPQPNAHQATFTQTQHALKNPPARSPGHSL